MLSNLFKSDHGYQFKIHEIQFYLEHLCNYIDDFLLYSLKVMVIGGLTLSSKQKL